MDELFSLKTNSQYDKKLEELRQFVNEQRQAEKQEIVEQFNNIENLLKNMRELISFNFANVLKELKTIASSLEKK